MLGSTLREFLTEAVDFDAVRELSTTETAIDTGVWNGLKDIGVVGLHIPEEFGGAGMSLSEAAVVFEELGRVVAAVPLLSSVAASSAVLFGGSEDQKARLLPSMAAGESVPTLAVYEHAHGGAIAGETVLDRTGDGWVLNGTKRFVTDAPNATAFVVVAQCDGEPALAVVSADAEGVSVEATPSLDATRPLGVVSFDGVAIDSADVITQAGDVVQRAVDVAATCLASEQVGGAQRCLVISVEYAKTRFKFGRDIGSFQAV
jgi:alkylation response protein AidB-like acyl-CoA dehydrogenase